MTQTYWNLAITPLTNCQTDWATTEIQFTTLVCACAQVFRLAIHRNYNHTPYQKPKNILNSIIDYHFKTVPEKPFVLRTYNGTYELVLTQQSARGHSEHGGLIGNRPWKQSENSRCSRLTKSFRFMQASQLRERRSISCDDCGRPEQTQTTYVHPPHEGPVSPLLVTQVKVKNIEKDIGDLHQALDAIAKTLGGIAEMTEKNQGLIKTGGQQIKKLFAQQDNLTVIIADLRQEVFGGSE